MIDRTTKLRWRRRLRNRKRQVEDMSVQAEEQLEEQFFNRMSRLMQVRRFALGWIFLVSLLIVGTVGQIRGLSQYYQELAPASGGTYSEGIIGTFTNANPLYATTAADGAVSHLVFSSLMRYDHKNRLVGDMADAIAVDERGTQYTVTLREGLKWQDGKPLTSEDVAFTYKTIQNPDAKSPLFSGWKDIKVETPDAKTIVFTLPNILASFPYSLVNGIVPKHVLGTTPAGQLRTSRFNSVAPVGSGPFKWEALEVAGTAQEEREEHIGLVPNELYYRGQPQLQQFIVRTFRTEERMLDSYRAGELTAMTGLNSVPDDIRNSDAVEHNIPLTGSVMVFFKNSLPQFADVKVREALVQSVNVPALTQTLGYPVIVGHGPLLPNQLGYDKAASQLPFDITAANRLLDEAGWAKGADSMRSKGGVPLGFQLSAQSTSDYVAISSALQKAWREVGVNVQVVLQSDTDVQGMVSRHDYEAVLYGISIGVDPDVFAYWHSSQADPRSASRLNLSEYKSNPADRALEAGRTRVDPQTRAAKYKPFLEAWRADAPALALYQPRFLYITRGQVGGFNPKVLNSTNERFSDVEQWTIRQAKITKE